MSLLITSSKQDRYKEQAMGIERPFSYSNHLNPPMTIPANAEVAVQSVKCSRSPNFRFNDNNKRFYLYFGKVPVDGANLTETNPSTTLQCIVPDGVYDTKQMAQALTIAINKNWGAAHPDCQLASVTVKEAAGKFDGWAIKLAQKLATTGGGAHEVIQGHTDAGFYPRPLLDDSGREMGPHYKEVTFYRNLLNVQSDLADIQTSGFVPDWWDNGTKVMTSVDGSANGGTAGNSFTGGVFPMFPMSHQDHTFAVTITDAVGASVTGFHFGLVRPVAAGDKIPADGSYDDAEGKFEYYGNGNAVAQFPPWADGGPNQHGLTFMDYQISSIKGADGDYYLHVQYFGHKHGSTANGNTDGPLRWDNEVEYWNNATCEAPGDGSGNWNAGRYNLTSDASTLQRVRFLVSNEQVNVDVYYGGGWKTLIKVQGANSDTTASLPNAGNPMRWELYPKMLIEDSAGCSLQITSYGCRNDMATSGRAVGGRPIDDAWEYGSGLYPNSMKNRLGRDLDARIFSDPGTVSRASDPILPTRTGGSSELAWVPWLIMKKTSLIEPSFVIRPYPNTDELLGFEGHTNMKSADGVEIIAAPGVAKQVTWSSVSIPAPSAEHSNFIRCPTLTQISQNFGKGSMSKILYHIPQFDSTGRSVGALFYEPHEKTYLKLGNSEPITLNQLQIDIVDKDEKFAKELDGDTIVWLHIKS